MLTDPQRDYLKSVLLTMQIVVVALAMGVAFFALVLIIIGLGQAGAAPPVGPMPISYIAAGAAAVAILVSALVPMLMAGPMRQAVVDGRVMSTMPSPAIAETVGVVAPLAASYMTRLIISSAILEGAAFFNLVAYLLEHQIYSLAIAGVLVALILVRFPTLPGLTDWCEHELKEIRQLRQMRRG